MSPSTLGTSTPTPATGTISRSPDGLALPLVLRNEGSDIAWFDWATRQPDRDVALCRVARDAPPPA